MILLRKPTLSILFLTSILFTSCNNGTTNCINGKGNIESQTIELTNFNKISSNISSKITIYQGDTQEFKIIGHPNIISEVNT